MLLLSDLKCSYFFYRRKRGHKARSPAKTRIVISLPPLSDGIDQDAKNTARHHTLANKKTLPSLPLLQESFGWRKHPTLRHPVRLRGSITMCGSTTSEPYGTRSKRWHSTRPGLTGWLGCNSAELSRTATQHDSIKLITEKFLRYFRLIQNSWRRRNQLVSDEGSLATLYSGWSHCHEKIMATFFGDQFEDKLYLNVTTFIIITRVSWVRSSAGAARGEGRECKAFWKFRTRFPRSNRSTFSIRALLRTATTSSWGGGVQFPCVSGNRRRLGLVWLCAGFLGNTNNFAYLRSFDQSFFLELPHKTL